MGAALFEGFVAIDLGLRYADASAGELEYLRHSLRLFWYVNQALANTGEVARALAMTLWSCAILLTGRSRLLGIAGVLIGAATAAAILLGMLRLNVHGQMLALFAAIAWNLALAVQLLRGKLQSAAEVPP